MEQGKRKNLPGQGRRPAPDEDGMVNLRTVKVPLDVRERLMAAAGALDLTSAEAHRQAIAAGLSALEKRARKRAKE